MIFLHLLILKAVNIFLLVLSIGLCISNSWVTGIEIKGAPFLATAPLPLRRDIAEFASAGPAFDLFVLALQRLQSINQLDPLSYFQIAGIHGYPVVPWDGVIGRALDRGYCMHASVLFPVWHRPYLALFEQQIWLHAQSIAVTYPPEQVERYLAAAMTLRVPYWDWAIHPAIPLVYSTPNISINTPTGYHEIKNPLYRYDFHPGPEGNGFPANHNLSNARFSTRWSSALLESSDDASADNALIALAPSTLADTYQLLTSVNDYTQFSNMLSNGGSATPNNIEFIHNRIHTVVGGWYGSMFWPEFAAFDPIFWLHHAQVDRLFAIWQTLYPESYVIPTNNPIGSYFEAPNMVDTVATFLAPFHSIDNETMFTAISAKNVSQFGYTYPELADLTSAGGRSERNNLLRSRINALYNVNLAQTQRRDKLPNPQQSSAATSRFDRLSLNRALEIGINNLAMQWSIRIQVSYYAHEHPVTILFFIGTAPKDITKWSEATNLIGSFSQFRTASSHQYNKLATSGPVTRGEVSITHALMAEVLRGSISSMSTTDVISLLQKHLTWRAKAANNQEICLDDIKGLSISVLSRQVRPSHKPSEFPRYGRYVIHPEITRDKIGGLIM